MKELEQALAVLRGCLDHPDAADAIAAIEAKLAAPAQEPVATVIRGHEVDLEGNLINPVQFEYYQDDINNLPVGTKLYTQPIPADMVLVPLEPTGQMLAQLCHWAGQGYVEKGYKAMLQAAKDSTATIGRTL